jgi:hypothetical protein
VAAYRAIIIGYAACGLAMAGLYACLSPRIEARPKEAAKGPRAAAGGAAAAAAVDDAEEGDEEDGAVLPLERRASLCGRLSPGRLCASIGLRRAATRAVITRLSILFAIDSFAGGFVAQTVLVPWMHARWGLAPAALGSMLMGANILGGVSAVGAGWLVKRVGAINTMVWTHLPSSVLLALVPLMPSGGAAVCMLLLRFCLSQMDVPARQGYVAMVVAPDERSAAGGVTNIVRSIGVAFAPVLVGPMLAAPASSTLFAAPFWLAAGLKIAYDLALYTMFRASERAAEAEAAGVKGGHGGAATAAAAAVGSGAARRAGGKGGPAPQGAHRRQEAEDEEEEEALVGAPPEAAAGSSGVNA